MPRIDERSPLHRLSRTTERESRSGSGEFTSAGPHPARWDDESFDPDDRRSGPGGPESRAGETEPRIDEREPHSGEAGLRPGEHGARSATGDPRGAVESSAPAWLSEPCGSVSLWHERLVPERFRGTRWDPGPRGVLIIAVVGVLAIVLAAMVALREEPVAQPVPPIAALTDTAPADSGVPSDSAGTPASPGSGDPAGGVVVTSKVAAAPGARNPLVPTAAGVPGPALTGSTAPAPDLVVSVVGLVEHGGLCRFRAGARVADALRVAGPRPEADLTGLNLAQHLTDGDQIIIGRTATPTATRQGGSTMVNSAHPSQDSPPGQPPSSRPGAPAPAPAAKINLNTATEAELDTLPGVGQVTARAILAWRSAHGRFTSIDQLSEIQGIGHSRLERLRTRVTI